MIDFSEKRIEEVVKDFYEHDGELKEPENENLNKMGDLHKEAYKRYKERYPEEEVISMARRISEWSNEKVTPEEIIANRERAKVAKDKTKSKSELNEKPLENQTEDTASDIKMPEIPEETSEQALSDDLGQLKELQNMYSSLELKFQTVLDELKELKQNNMVPNKVNEVSEDATRQKTDIKATLDSAVQQVKNAVKQKSKAAIRASLQAIKFDTFLSKLVTGLKKLENSLTSLENMVQSLGVTNTVSRSTIDQISPTSQEIETKEATVEKEKPRIKIGKRRPENFSSVIQSPKIKPKVEPEVIEKVSEEVIPPVVEQEKNVKENTVSQGLPEDFRPILENMFIPIDAAHETKDEEGRPTYGYRVNQQVDVPGIPLDSIKGLDSINISKLLRADLVERIMDKRLSVDEVFTEEQKDQMISSYSKAKMPLNAFEKRVAKAEGVKKEVKATASQEITQEKHRSR